MTICPIALAVSCVKCPVVSVCPLKRVIGDIANESKKPHPKDAKKTWPK